MFGRNMPRKTIASVVIVVFSSLVLTSLNYVAGGIIGNAAYALLPWVWKQVTKSIAINSWPWIITLIILFLGLGGILYLWLQNKLLRQALNTTDKIIKLENSFLKQLASIVATSDIKDETRRLLERFLQNATEAFPEDAYKASILLPDNNREYLQIRVSYQMSAESRSRAKFYVGQDAHRQSERGTAGLTYLDEKIRVGHVERKKGCWEWDAEGYISFGGKRPYPSHYSFICMPIIGIDPVRPLEGQLV